MRVAAGNKRRTTFPHKKRFGERDRDKGKGNIYSQAEVCTQCMHSNMYLMHNKMERPVTQRLSESKREKTCGRWSERGRKIGNNDNKNEYTKKCEKHGVQCIYHIRPTDKCSRYFFPSLFFLQYFFLPLSLTFGILSVCLSFSLSIISVSVSPAHRTRAHLHISAVCFISFSFILVWSFICHLVARTL